MKFRRAVLGSLILVSFPVFAQIADSTLPGNREDAPDRSSAPLSEPPAMSESTDNTQLGGNSGGETDGMSRAERKRQVIRQVLEDSKAQPDYIPAPPPPTNRYDEISR